METTHKTYDAIDRNEDSRPETSKSQGAEALRIACDLVLAQDALEIAQSMGKSSREGHVMSARFLFEHAVELEKQGDKEGAREVRSIVQKLYEEAVAMGEIDEAEDDDITNSPAPAVARYYN